MPSRVVTKEKYWSICYYKVKIPFVGTIKIPYLCLKEREVVKWCYSFTVVHESCTVFYADNYGCENGVEYNWSGVCFGWFDAYHPGPIYKCFDEQLESLGSCREGKSIPPGGDIPGGHWVPDNQVSVGGPWITSGLLVTVGTGAIVAGVLALLEKKVSPALFAAIFAVGLVFVLLGPLFFCARKRRGSVVYPYEEKDAD